MQGKVPLHLILNLFIKKLRNMNFKLFAAIFVLFAGLTLVSCQKTAKADDAATENLTTDANTAKADSKVAPIGKTEPAKQAKTSTSILPDGPTTTVKFEEMAYDFGTIMEGEKVRHSYKFTNTGDEILVITNAKASCGCTVPNYSDGPIKPGETGEITVEYSARKIGTPEGKPESKRITVTANTNPPNTYLTIKGKVKKDA
jgi:hypothetical protein